MRRSDPIDKLLLNADEESGLYGESQLLLPVEEYDEEAVLNADSIK